ncbi:MAG: SAV_2336 N-terminal domain-related protein, partial [Waterburya sp.]
LRHPDPPSLQEPLEFAKALRPLIRKVDSGRKTVLDEVETVQRTAEENICIPVFKNEPEPWLDLALIVDENPSMVIWNSTIKELKQLLERYGIFREARIWGLGTDDQGKMVIRAKVGKKESFKNPQELVDPTNRRLILIVSDCVAPIWFDGTILSTLEQWTKYQPLAIIQMLPNFMWQRTGLRIGAFVELSNLISGAANRNLRIHELLLWKEIKVNQGTNINQGTKIPVLTLNPEITSLWSNFVVGKYDSLMTGFVLPLDSDFQELPPLPQSPQSRVETLDAEQRVNRFRRMSSPVGRNLAGYLMAAPVITLPVVRLIQKIFLPHSQPIHMAEVFLGGLLKPSIKITTETNPDGVVFDVIDDEIRNIILDDFPLSDSVNVFRAISNFIESNIRKSLRECVALLAADPSAIGDKEALAKAYAEISLKVLKGMGGSYAELAKEIEISSNLSSRSAQTKILFETLGIEPKTLPFEIATFEEEVEPLVKISFKIVTLVRKEQIKNRLSLEEIKLIEQHHSKALRTPKGYQSYQELKEREQEGTDYRIETYQGISDAVIIAPHGGKIEPGATQITKAIAGDDHGFYSLEGLKEGNNHILSIPSEKFDEPRALEIVGEANRVIAIHGFFDNKEMVYLEGLDADLRQKIKENLEKERFWTKESGSDFEGENPNNICNRGKAEKGVHIGIAWGLIQKLLDSLKSEDTNEPTLYHRFVQAIRDALSPLEAAGLRSQITQGQADFYTEELANNRGLDMIRIPGGSFTMGSPKEELESYDDERPQHQVTVPSFYMGRYPITPEQWRIVAEWEPVEI